MSRFNKRGFLNTPVFTIQNVLVFILVASVFLFTFYMRHAVSSQLAYMNLPFYIAIMLLMLKYRGRASVAGCFVWAALATMYFLIEGSAGTGISDMVQFFFLYCAPLVVCQLVFGRDAEEKLAFARTIIALVNVFTLVVFLILVVDMLTGSAVMRALTTNVLSDMAPWVPSEALERHPSIWGHYLITAGFYLAFFYMNVAYAKVTGSWILDMRLVYVVATVGIISTGGKTALVIYLASIIWLNLTDKHGLRNAVMLTFFLLLLYGAGLFDIVLERFGAEDLSSGRNEAAEAVFSVELPRLLWGYGESFAPYMSARVTSYIVSIFSEYSFLALAYKFGLVFVALIIVLLLRAPFITARLTRKWSVAFMGALLVLYFSTFNAFSVLPDAYLICSLYAIVVSMLADCCEGESGRMRSRISGARNPYRQGMDECVAEMNGPSHDRLSLLYGGHEDPASLG